MIRKILSSPGLYELIDTSFEKNSDHRKHNITYKLKDIISAGLGMFTFKYGSLASFLEDAAHPQIRSNIKTLF